MSATWTHPSRLDTLVFDWIFKAFEEMIEIDDVGICFILYLRHQLGSH